MHMHRMLCHFMPCPPAGDRFAKYGIQNTEENRRAYRQMLFEAQGANNYLSAAILDPETLYQRRSVGGVCMTVYH